MKVIFILYLILYCQILTASCNEISNTIKDAGVNVEKNVADSSNVRKNENVIEKEYHSIIIKIKYEPKDLLPYDTISAEYNYLEKYLNSYYEKGYELHSIIPIESTGYKIELVYTSEIIVIFKKIHDEKN